MTQNSPCYFGSDVIIEEKQLKRGTSSGGGLLIPIGNESIDQQLIPKHRGGGREQAFNGMLGSTTSSSSTCVCVCVSPLHSKLDKKHLQVEKKLSCSFRGL